MRAQFSKWHLVLVRKNINSLHFNSIFVHKTSWLKIWHRHVVDKIPVVNWIALKCLEICNKSKLGDPCNKVWNYRHVFVCTENFQSQTISVGFIQFQPVSVQCHFLESKLKILNFQNLKLVFIYHTPNSAGRLSKYCCKYAYGSFCQSKP